MKKLLLVSATPFEIEPVLQFLDVYKKSPGHFIYGKLSVEVCITKAGMVATAFELGRLNGKNFDMAINAGVAGSFGKHVLGEVLHVTEDCFSELGAEDDTRFLSIDEIGLGEQRIKGLHPLKNKIIDRLQKAKGITVNTVHGNEASIEKAIGRYTPDTESMEGAAFFYAANAYGWEAAQIRAISNKVEKRNKASWQMGLAIKNLNEVLIELFKDLSQ
jgi:futalosine hydrolase